MKIQILYKIGQKKSCGMQYSMYGGFLPYKQCVLHMAPNGAYITLLGSYAATYLEAERPPWADCTVVLSL